MTRNIIFNLVTFSENAKIIEMYFLKTGWASI